MSNQKSKDNIESEIENITKEYENLPERKIEPKSFLSIIDSSYDERPWNFLLYYFLDPKQPHGLGDSFLNVFLEEFTDITTDDDLSEVKVENQPITDTGKIPDLFIYSPGQWGICIELKVRDGIGSNQLENYILADEIEECLISDLEEIEYILIGKEKHENTTEETKFKYINWKQIHNLLEEFTSQIYKKHIPTWTNHQLLEFKETIKDELEKKESIMDEREKELLKLYMNHYESINDITTSWDDFRKKKWWPLFNDYCENEADNNPFSEEKDSWLSHEVYGHIYKENWWLDKNGFPAQSSHDIYLQFHFSHNINKDSIKNGIFEWKVQFNYPQDIEELISKFKFDSLSNFLQDINSSGKVYSEPLSHFEISNFPDSYFKKLFKSFKKFREKYEEKIDSFMNEVQNELRK